MIKRLSSHFILTLFILGITPSASLFAQAMDEERIFNKLFETQEDILYCDNEGNTVKQQIWKCFDVELYRIMESYDSYRAFILVEGRDPIEIYRLEGSANGIRKSNFLLRGPWEAELITKLENLANERSDISNEERAKQSYMEFYKKE